MYYFFSGIAAQPLTGSVKTLLTKPTTDSKKGSQKRRYLESESNHELILTILLSLRDFIRRQVTPL